MKKSVKKTFLIIAGIILCIVVLGGIYIYRNVHIDMEVFHRIDRMDSKEDTPKLVKIFSNRLNPIMVRKCAFEQMAHAVKDPAAVEPLVKILERKLELTHFRAEAAFTLGCIGNKKGIEPLIKALEYGSGIKEAALQGLTFIEVKDERVVFAARRLLNDESEVIRDLAIIALGVHGGEEDVDLLIEQLENGDRGERSNAARALGKIGDRKAVEPLIERLENDTRSTVIRASCVALGKIGDRRAIEPLIRMLKGIAYVEATIALGQIGDKRAVQPIVEEIKKPYHNEDGRNKLKEVYKTLTGHEYREDSE